MKKIAILLIVLMVVSVGFLSGCTEQPKSNNGTTEQLRNKYHIGDSVKVGYMNFTFLSATGWANITEHHQNFWVYPIEIGCKNEGINISVTSNIYGTLYILENGTQIAPKPVAYTAFSMFSKTGSTNKTYTLLCGEYGAFVRNSPVAEVYIGFLVTSATNMVVDKKFYENCTLLI